VITKSYKSYQALKENFPTSLSVGVAVAVAAVIWVRRCD